MKRRYRYQEDVRFVPGYGVRVTNITKPRGYGLSNLVGDLTLTAATGGVWAIWWIIREVSR